MPAQANDENPQIRRRRRRVLTAIPFSAMAWVMVTGLPFGPTAARPGEMHTEIVTLSGPSAERTPAALPAATADAAPSTKSLAELRTAPTAAGPGWSASIDVADGTQSVAASWTGAPTGAVEVRGFGPDGWTGWAELEADPDDGPDDSVRDSGGMAWFSAEGVDQVEVKVTKGQLADLELQPMRYEAPSGSTGLVTAMAGASAAQPEIQPRSLYTSKGWATANSGCASGPISASGGVKFAVVHHTVNANTYDPADVPAMLASIYTYHTGTNGWCDTAYNFIVDRFGRIWEGRSGGVTKPIVGGHAQGFNTGSVGVSFLGQFEPGASPTAVQPSTQALNAASQLIGWKLGIYGIDPTGKVTVTSGGSNKYPSGTVLTIDRVIGHRDVGYTACPGANLYDKLPSVRTAAKAAQGAPNPTTTTTTTTPPPPKAYAPFGSASQLVKQQYRDVLRRDPSADDLAYWTARVGNTWSPGQFIAHMTSSTEADNRVHAVTRLYRAYFGRNPDHSGFTYWMNRRGEGRSLVSISQSFATSSEFINKYGSLSNAAFVDRVYQNVLGRRADSGGTTYWTTRLNAGMSRGQVMANFSQSSEYVRSTKDGVQVVAIYEAMLQRAVKGDVYTLFETGLRTSQTSLTGVATYVFDSSEYAARFR